MLGGGASPRARQGAGRHWRRRSRRMDRAAPRSTRKELRHRLNAPKGSLAQRYLGLPLAVPSITRDAGHERRRPWAGRSKLGRSVRQPLRKLGEKDHAAEHRTTPEMRRRRGASDGVAGLGAARRYRRRGRATGAGHRAGDPAPGDRAAVRQARHPACAPPARQGLAPGHRAARAAARARAPPEGDQRGRRPARSGWRRTRAAAASRATP